MTLCVAILGGGALGRAVCRITAAASARVLLWARSAEAVRDLAEEYTTVSVAPDVASACHDADVVFFAVPASALGEVAAQYGEVARGDQIVLHAVRGACPGEGFVLPHQVLRQETCVRKIGVVGGPIYSPDPQSARLVPGIVASRFDETFAAALALTAGTSVRLARSHDVVGVEVIGAFANVTAIATGIADGQGFGDTVYGLLRARGFYEAARLGVLLGASRATFSGLAGIGELIPRHNSNTQKNVDFGGALGRGQGLTEALVLAGGEVEGGLTAARAAALAERLGLTLPLCRAVADVAVGDRDPAEAIEAVLNQPLPQDLEPTAERASP